ncbi:MAG: hypothetical protein P8X58_13960 [Syntrophobacterales bacterium]
MGSIIYKAKGSMSFSRERVEVYGDESVGVIEDFRRGQIIRGSTSRTTKKRSMDMGYAAELEYFLRLESNPEYYRQLFEGYVASTRATLKAAESLRTGKIVPV